MSLLRNMSGRLLPYRLQRRAMPSTLRLARRYTARSGAERGEYGEPGSIARGSSGDQVFPLAALRGSWGVLAEAMALQESGILIHGCTVTDLATGYKVSASVESAPTGDNAGAGSRLRATHQESFVAGECSPPLLAQEDPFLAEKGQLCFRGTNLGLRQLDSLRHSVQEVMDKRLQNPEYAQVDCPGGRTQFPWGVGLEHPDVVVTGVHAAVISEYLRCAGFRARVADAERGLRIAAQLQEVQQWLSDHSVLGQAADGYYGDEPQAEPCDVPSAQPGFSAQPGVIQGDGHRGSQEGRRSSERGGDVSGSGAGGRSGGAYKVVTRWSTLSLATRRVLAASAVLVSIGGASVGVTALRSHFQPRGTPAAIHEAAAQTQSPAVSAQEPRAQGSSPEEFSPEESSTDNPTAQDSSVDSPSTPQPWREHHVVGEGITPAATGRADVPVELALPGWSRIGANAQREEFMSADTQMRVLVSAVPTPLATQQELDQAVLEALGRTPEVRIVGRSPVSYEEVYPDSTTVWHVKLMVGYQISVGCQFREITDERLRICDDAVEMARPEG